jgi:hypothetical protein
MEQLWLCPHSLLCATTIRGALTDYQPFGRLQRARLPQLQIGDRLFDQLGTGTLKMSLWHAGAFHPAHVKDVVWLGKFDTSRHVTVFNGPAIGQLPQQAGGVTLVTYGKLTSSN